MIRGNRIQGSLTGLRISSGIVNIVILLVLATSVVAQDITVSQSVDRTSMAFEDTAHFRVTLIWSGPPQRYLFHKPLRLDADNLAVTRFSSSVSSQGSGDAEVTTKIYDYHVALTLSGSGTVRPLEIEYLLWPDSVNGTLTTDPVVIQIANPRPKASSPGLGLLPYLGGGFVIAGGVVLVVVVLALHKRRRSRAPARTKSPRDRFLDDLTVVRAEAGPDLKKFQTGLYRALSGYLKARYDVDTNKLSGDALAERLKDAQVEPSQVERIIGWLIRAEREKFAPVAAPPGEVVRLDAEIRQFFERIQ